VIDSIREAELKIADILCQLELEAGVYVRAINLPQINATQLADGFPRLVRRVAIEAEGRSWDRGAR
jgi:hypothetical protein